MSEEAKTAALRRAEILRPLLARESEGLEIGKAVGSAAELLGVSRSTAWRLLALLRENDGRASALVPKRSGPKQGLLRLNEQVESIIDQGLRHRYLVSERPSLRRIVEEIRAECSAKGFQPPARQTIKARLDAMDQRHVVLKRRGAKAADQQFAARAGALDVTKPLNIVQIDHTLADIILVDHAERRPLARPWLTLAIDVATRIVLGVYVSFDAPSVLSIGLCLAHCVRPKSLRTPDQLEELYWPSAGIPHAIHVDNGQDFRSEAFQDACAEWGISIEYRPRGKAHYGGHIERLIGTTMGAVHVLPGTTQSSPKDRGTYDSVGKSAMTLDEFQDWLNLEICRYNNTRHSGLGRTPMAAWADLSGDDAGRQVVDFDAFQVSFLPTEQRQLRRTGISLFSIGYWSDAFGPLIGRGTGKVKVKYDPRDMSQIWVITDDGRTISARYRDLSRPVTSLWELRRARALYHERHGGTLSETMLFRIVEEQRRIAFAAKQQTLTARLEGERQARLPSDKPKRDPSREMFAIDTSNPDLPTYPIDDFDGLRRKN
ncbi:Mu transposase C-terminal domain-containing protein [Cognatiyoonia sp. IB215182]|uniref:Mu transposase C-terminal domain-containing protein n=1 Tax=Cognatiyoonia sp. IB215182 TaxID=3097353 RepID=UPI002A0BF4F1|nr:Mu transposase C-terminal domain-containing protein [Cognatiyoonia sp. IB215182]MDX8354837.1 Mu transposase C-terminal domain-containing protein [Cognatiyoonia sp. IB215182]